MIVWEGGRQGENPDRVRLCIGWVRLCIGWGKRSFAFTLYAPSFMKQVCVLGTPGDLIEWVLCDLDA